MNWHFLITYIPDLNTRIFSDSLGFLIPVCTSQLEYSEMERPINCFLNHHFKWPFQEKCSQNKAVTRSPSVPLFVCLVSKIEKTILPTCVKNITPFATQRVLEIRQAWHVCFQIEKCQQACGEQLILKHSPLLF